MVNFIFRTYKTINQPSQVANLQCWTWSKSPVQLRAVAPRGSGELHNRERDLKPLPQVLEQEVNSDHWPKPPSTEKWTK